MFHFKKGGARGRKKKAEKDLEKEKLEEEREKPYSCEGNWYSVLPN